MKVYKRSGYVKNVPRIIIVSAEFCPTKDWRVLQPNSVSSKAMVK